MKEARSLRDAGYSSAVLCPPIAGRPSRETWQNIEVFRPRVLAGASATLDKLLYQSTFLSPAWYRAIRQVIDAYRPDVLHVHDIWLGRSALLARHGQRMVMDLHENMPAAIVEYLRGYRGAHRAFNAVFKGYRRVFRYERALLAGSDLVLTVVEEAAGRVREAHPMLDQRRITNVENLESREFLSAPPADRRMIPGDHFSILYIGGFGPHRGIDTLIRAMRHLKDWDVSARLYLVGAREGGAYLEMLRSLIADLDVSSHVDIVGWVPAESVLGYIRDASVGAVPHHSNPHTDSTIPHKLFQYMIASTPVIVSTSVPLARTVGASGAGVVFMAGDPLDCARKIQALAGDPARCEQLGRAGRRYVLEDGHNWEDESAPRLIAAYDSLFEREPA